MSAQTIIHPSITSIKKKAEDTLIDIANKNILKEYYALGDGYCDFDYLNAALTIDIINTNSCVLYSIINSEIEYKDKCTVLNIEI